jgi:peptidoglycan hydrolase-like protein with peptidoglycan-binding domain
MINHFVKFLYRKLFFAIVGLSIIIGAAVVIIPVNIIHAATVNCPPQIQEGSTNTVEVNELHSALQSHYNQGDLKNGKPYNFLATSNGAFGGGFGLETREAVMDYQSQHGLGVDGVVGPQTWGSLLGVACGSNPNSGTTSNSTINTGSTVPKSGTCYSNISEGTSDSATTKILQNILISKGYSVGSSAADGQFGPNTTKAVESFQRSAKIGVDGRIGSQTWKALGYCSNGVDHYGNNNSGQSSNNNSGQSSNKSSGSISCSAGQTLINKSCYTCKPGTEVYNNGGQVVACDSNTANSSTSTAAISTTAYNYCIAGQNGPNSLPLDKTVNCSLPSAQAEQLCENGYNDAHGYSSDMYTACADYNKH